MAPEASESGSVTLRVHEHRRGSVGGLRCSEPFLLRDDLLSSPAMATRDEVDAALKNAFVPALRARGFKGTLPHFRRVDARHIALLTIQFDRNGGGFVVEIARCGLEGFTTSWGRHVPPNKVTAHDLHPSDRHRLGSPSPGVDGIWFRFDDGTSAKRVAERATQHLDEADRWWAR